MRDLPRVYTESVGHVTVDDSRRTAVLPRRAKVHWVRLFAASDEHAAGARVMQQDGPARDPGDELLRGAAAPCVVRAPPRPA